MKNKSYLLLKDKRIIRSILILAIPIMLSNIIKSLHDIIDMFFISNINDEVELVEAQVSAITVTGPIIMICQALAIGFMVAGSAMMSQYLGAGNTLKAKKVSGQLLLLCIIVGVSFNILLYFLAPFIIKWMGSDPNSSLYYYAVTYVQYRAFELIGLFVLYAFQATRQSNGDTISPVILNIVTIVLNIILTWAFINLLGMDIRGAALGTVIANMVIIPVCIIMMMRKNNTFSLELTDLVPDFKYIKKVFSLGMPAAISQAFTSLGFLLINSLVMGFDNYIINAIGVGGRINSLLLYPSMSIGSVLATFVGQNIGASQIDRAKKSLHSAMVISLVLTVGGAFILMFLRGPMVSIFIDPVNNPDAFDMCVYYLYFLLVGLPLMGIFQIWNGCFQGAGRTDLGLFLSTTRLWILRLPLIWFLMHIVQIGPPSIWYAMSISNFGAVILGTFLYKFVDFKPRVSKIKQRLMKQEERKGEVTNFG